MIFDIIFPIRSLWAILADFEAEKNAKKI